MSGIRTILLGALVLCLAAPPAQAARQVRHSPAPSQRRCCSVAQPCWGQGPKKGMCCRGPGNVGCKPALPCRKGMNPQSLRSVCAALKAHKAKPSPRTWPVWVDNLLGTLKAAKSALAGKKDPVADRLASVVTSTLREFTSAKVFNRLAVSKSSVVTKADAAGGTQSDSVEPAGAGSKQPAASPAPGKTAGVSPSTAAAASSPVPQLPVTPPLPPIWATYHYYAPAYDTADLYCADTFNRGFATFGTQQFGQQLLRHAWTAYCGTQLGPMNQNLCGKCMSVTNPATGVSTVLTIVDMCGNGGLDVDPLGFNAVDTNGAGYLNGHLWLTVNGIVPC